MLHRDAVEKWDNVREREARVYNKVAWGICFGLLFFLMGDHVS
jgi:hypothetical protein